MRIIFIRHGDPNYEQDCLTPAGIPQAQRTADRLADEGISMIFASPQGRAQQTASFTAERLGLPISTLPFMHEISWGNPDNGDPEFKTGHPWNLGEKMLSSGYDAHDWLQHPYFEQNKCLDYLKLVSEGFDEWLASLGWQREGSVYRCVTPSDRTVALFAHGGSGACALSHLLNLSFPYMCAAMPFDFCSVSVFELSGKAGDIVFPRIVLYNDSKHTKEDRSGKPVFGN